VDPAPFQRHEPKLKRVAAPEERSERDELLESLRERLEAQEAELATLRSTLADVRPDEVPVEPAARERTATPTEQYLLCVPTPGGYVLLNRLGRVPRVGDDIDVPEEDGSFSVAKVVPLPRNGRPCAYLQRDRPDA
jgi:hypothetical protein